MQYLKKIKKFVSSTHKRTNFDHSLKYLIANKDVALLMNFLTLLVINFWLHLQNFSSVNTFTVDWICFIYKLL